MMFPSRADAWLFRQTAYDFAGLTRKGVHSHDAYPPAKITVITRKRKNGRFFENEHEFLAAIIATGLEVEVIEEPRNIPFKQIVEKMAGTGILIAAHGAALVNAMFLPQHAVVIEIFPYFMKKLMWVLWIYELQYPAFMFVFIVRPTSCSSVMRASLPFLDIFIFLYILGSVSSCYYDIFLALCLPFFNLPAIFCSTRKNT